MGGRITHNRVKVELDTKTGSKKGAEDVDTLLRGDTWIGTSSQRAVKTGDVKKPNTDVYSSEDNVVIGNDTSKGRRMDPPGAVLLTTTGRCPGDRKTKKLGNLKNDLFK